MDRILISGAALVVAGAGAFIFQGLSVSPLSESEQRHTYGAEDDPLCFDWITELDYSGPIL